MSTHDANSLHRFTFAGRPVRGALVQLPAAYQAVLACHDYPEALQHLLGEALAAVSLLTATLKIEGKLSLQIQGEGALRLMLVQGNHRQELRALAQWQGEVDDEDLTRLLTKGQLALTIEPEQGQRYQGIVPLAGARLAQCLEAYFAQSEQLPTRLYLAADGHSAAGLLLQALPAEQDDGAAFQHAEALADTLKAEELLGLPPQEILYRLYHQDELELYPASPVSFRCQCSRERCLNSLATVDFNELQHMLAQDGEIAMNCDFCNKTYVFTPADIQALFPEPGSPTRH
ncbi:MAG: Hsp33 family molecular chaperone HslO [Gammaproteobacteria bacterium]|nr:Hsp33 family molecular chaperone HslO [Gammaproteobacteria bacterium]